MAATQRGTGGGTCGRAGRAAKKLHLVVPASPDSGAQARGSPRGAGATGQGGCPKGALGAPAAQPRRAAHEPPGTPSPAGSLAPGGPSPSETLPVTVEAITITSHGIPYRTERTTLAARRVGAGQTTPSPAPPAPDQAERRLAAKVFALLTALDPDKRLRKAPPIKVFNLYYRQRLEPAEIARICRCDRSLIFHRLAAFKRTSPGPRSNCTKSHPRSRRCSTP